MTQKATNNMMYKATLGRHQLAVLINRKPGRPKNTHIYRFFNFTRYLTKLATNKRLRGHPVSRILRCVFENKKIKKTLGINLTLIVFLTGIATHPASAFRVHPEDSPRGDQAEIEITALTSDSVELTTEQSVRTPLDSFVINQGFHFLHRGLDLKEVYGAPVYPTMDGVIEEVVHNRFSYGNHIIINHGSGYKSLYAHLSKIVVEKGQEVDKNTVIGQVGSTGWSTGFHLHFEVWENGRPINPLTILK